MGLKVPPFKIQGTAGEADSIRTVTEKDLKNQYTVLYFYPKDSTSGCTTEGLEFTDLISQFKKLNCQIWGVSRDSLKSHQNFICKQDFSFELLSDADEVLCRIFDVIQEKNMYGKKVMGIERSTFIIDPKGCIVWAARKVKAQGHAAQVLEVLKSL